MNIVYGNDGITIDELRDKIDQQFQQFQQFYANDEALNFDMVNTKEDAGEHYRYEYKGIKLDPARIAQVYGITNHMQFFVIKKGLKAGKRGHKHIVQDIKDIQNACDRWLEMLAEDELID